MQRHQAEIERQQRLPLEKQNLEQNEYGKHSERFYRKLPSKTDPGGPEREFDEKRNRHIGPNYAGPNYDGIPPNFDMGNLNLGGGKKSRKIKSRKIKSRRSKRR